jgi:hypothetical protein
MVAVIGNGDPDPARDRLAEELGAALARSGYGLVCGGLGGVMEAACRGAQSAGADVPVVGVLPGTDRAAANPHVDVAIATGMGYARNLVVVLSADAVVAVGGASGTLSEMAHAWQLGKPLCALGGVPGWATDLAGRSLDGKRQDAVFAASSVAEVEAWLGDVLPTDG